MSNNFLRKIRETKRLSLPQLSEKVGVTRQLLWGFEKGKNNLSTNVLQKLSEVLGCKISQILGEDSIDDIDDSLAPADLTAKATSQKQDQKLAVVSNNDYPIKDEYLGYAMEIVDEMIDKDFHSKDDKVHMLSEVYKIVYDFYENNDDKADFAREIEKKIIANQGFLKFINKIDFGKKITKKLLDKGIRKENKN